MAAYALVMRLDEDTALRVGALGKLPFPRGYYVYVGSAVRGMASRVARHMRRDKRLRWHVDYLTRQTRIVAAWCDPGDEAHECLWSRRLARLKEANLSPRGFGSSDCRCPSHLIHLSQEPEFAALLRALYGGAPAGGSAFPPGGSGGFAPLKRSRAGGGITPQRQSRRPPSRRWKRRRN